MIDRSHIEAAHDRICGRVRRTPVMALERGAFGLEAALSLKLELFQHTGSFKPRGAFNTLLSTETSEAGVVAASGGNHGAAVAYVAQALGCPAHIYVPEISSPVKIARIESYGAKLHVGGRDYAEALERSERFKALTGAVGVHAYDQETTLAGQGTVGLEWEEQTPDLDTILVAVGGGGLLGGIAAWYCDRVK
ncbi:MAG: pyridoxal-phosphate dependent enzyme, partial [Methyloligellaceae bacterium]